MFQVSPHSLEVIGEDTNMLDFSSNVAEVGMTVTELTAYHTLLSSITHLSFKEKTVTQLPPGTMLTNLTVLDLNGCSNITQIPMTYPASLQTIKASSTKLSSIPSMYSSLTLLDVSNCKRISSIGIPTLRTLIMSHSAITELTQLENLVRLIALNTKIVSIPSAPNLVIVMWSGISNSNLQVDSSNLSLVQILTTGPEGNVSSSNGLITSLLL